jgi:hypothetical protein
MNTRAEALLTPRSFGGWPTPLKFVGDRRPFSCRFDMYWFARHHRRYTLPNP